MSDRVVKLEWGDESGEPVYVFHDHANDHFRPIRTHGRWFSDAEIAESHRWLLEAFAYYAVHDVPCDFGTDEMLPCSCGLEELMRRVLTEMEAADAI